MQTPRPDIPSREIRKLGIYFLGFAALLSVLVLFKLARSGTLPWQGYLAAVFAAAGAACLVLGARAEGVYRAWAALGMLLGRIVSPLVFGLLYYLILTPFGLALRWMKPDPLGLRIRREDASYWREPEVRRSSRKSLLRQF